MGHGSPGSHGARRRAARLALRLINVDPATAASELQKALNGPGGVFQSNADNAVMKWSERDGIRRFLKPAGYTGQKPRGGESGTNGLAAR